MKKQLEDYMKPFDKAMKNSRKIHQRHSRKRSSNHSIPSAPCRHCSVCGISVDSPSSLSSSRSGTGTLCSRSTCRRTDYSRYSGYSGYSGGNDRVIAGFESLVNEYKSLTRYLMTVATWNREDRDKGKAYMGPSPGKPDVRNFTWNINGFSDITSASTSFHSDTSSECTVCDALKLAPLHHCDCCINKAPMGRVEDWVFNGEDVRKMDREKQREWMDDVAEHLSKAVLDPTKKIHVFLPAEAPAIEPLTESERSEPLTEAEKSDEESCD